jgi:hypothetical protein
MAEDQQFKVPKFSVKPSTDGKSWSVFCAVGYRRPIEIPDFSSEKAAHYWIGTVSKSWLEKRRKAGLDV